MRAEFGEGVTRPILIVPGYRGSGPGHWQSLWEERLPGARRVLMPSWEEPRRDAWVEALDRAIRACAEPPVLVGHSLGAVTIVHWAQGFRLPVHGALLVAPCDVDSAEGPEQIRSFAPVPISKLDFPTLAVVSSDDPYMGYGRALAFAHGWGARLASVGACGHINAEAGFGPWPEGEAFLREFL
jgi:serine hydrolase